MPKTYDHGDANDSIPSGADATITDPPLGGCTYYNGSAYVEVDLTSRLPVQIGDFAGTAATFDGSDPATHLTPGRGLKTYTQVYAYCEGDGVCAPLTVTSNGELVVSGAVNVAAAANVPVYVRLSNGTTGVAAATEAKQDTGNTSLASIDGKTPALGQALAAASVPVVLTAAQLTSLTAPVLGAGTNAIGKLAANSGVTIGAVEIAAAQTLATVTTVGTVTNVVHVDDNAGSLTVDAPVGTPVFVRLSDGSAAITTLPVSLASVPSHNVTNAGTFAVQAACAGDVASASTDSGNPVKIGGKVSTSVPAAGTNGNRTDAYFDARGRLGVAIGSSGTDVGGATPNDALSSAFGLMVNTQAQLYDGSSSWNRQRNNHEVTALASAARTTATNSSDLTNYNSRGVVVVVDVTAGGGAGGITVTIKGKDTLSGKYSTILAGAVITGTGTTKLVVYPGCDANPNLIANEPLPRVWRVEVTVADSTSYTYSIGANYIL